MLVVDPHTFAVVGLDANCPPQRVVVLAIESKRNLARTVDVPQCIQNRTVFSRQQALRTWIFAP